MIIYNFCRNFKLKLEHAKEQTFPKIFKLKHALLIMSDLSQNLRKLFLYIMEYISSQHSPKFTTSKIICTVSNIGS